MGEFPKIRGPQYRPPNTIILIIGTPRKVPLILGNYHGIRAMDKLETDEGNAGSVCLETGS